MISGNSRALQIRKGPINYGLMDIVLTSSSKGIDVQIIIIHV